jgi:hypothetical protein
MNRKSGSKKDYINIKAVECPWLFLNFGYGNDLTLYGILCKVNS